MSELVAMLAVAYSCRLLRPVVRRRRREPEDARTTLLPQSEALSGNRQHVKTIVNVRSAVARLASFPFEDERERLAEMTEEELPLAAPLLRGSALRGRHGTLVFHHSEGPLHSS